MSKFSSCPARGRPQEYMVRRRETGRWQGRWSVSSESPSGPTWPPIAIARYRARAHLKSPPIDRKRARAIPIHKVSPLNHERMNDAMKQAVLVTLRDAVHAMGADAERAKVGDRPASERAKGRRGPEPGASGEGAAAECPGVTCVVGAIGPRPRERATGCI